MRLSVVTKLVTKMKIYNLLQLEVLPAFEACASANDTTSAREFLLKHGLHDLIPSVVEKTWGKYVFQAHMQESSDAEKRTLCNLFV